MVLYRIGLSLLTQPQLHMYDACDLMHNPDYLILVLLVLLLTSITITPAIVKHTSMYCNILGYWYRYQYTHVPSPQNLVWVLRNAMEYLLDVLKSTFNSTPLIQYFLSVCSVSFLFFLFVLQERIKQLRSLITLHAWIVSQIVNTSLLPIFK